MDTIPSLLLDRFAKAPHATAVLIKQAGTYTPHSWEELYADVRCYAAKFLACGLEPGDRVAQFSENRYEWIAADFAMHLLGLVHVPIHSTLAGAQVIEQITHSGAALLLVSSDTLYEKLKDLELPARLSVFGFEASDRLDRFNETPVQPLTTAEIQQHAQQVTPDSLATILYTSGTTGEPKGVMLSQRNLTTNAVNTNAAISQDESDLRLCFLPLSHIFARTCDLYGWLNSGAQLALVESRETIVSDAQAVCPTVLNGVPYFFSSIKRSLEVAGVADQLGMVRETLGGRIKYCCSGGAALPADLYDFFKAQGTPILQGYGLTESSPVISVSSFSVDRRGSVGKPIEGVEVAIAEDGEVLTRGEHVMVGYFKNERATNEVIQDGWLHTGDLGSVDEDGFLYITGRKKELIVTATGKNISPSYIESLLVAESTIAQAIVIGDDRRFLSALIVPDYAYIEKHEQVVGDELQQLIAERIRARLSVCGKHEQVVKFTLLDRPFSIEHGEMTAKLSLRRAVIEANFAAEIEAMYE